MVAFPRPFVLSQTPLDIPQPEVTHVQADTYAPGGNETILVYFSQDVTVIGQPLSEDVDCLIGIDSGSLRGAIEYTQISARIVKMKFLADTGPSNIYTFHYFNEAYFTPSAVPSSGGIEDNPP